MNNGRDCPHGRQVGKCDTCDLITVELELEKMTAERDALAAQVKELKSELRQEKLIHIGFTNESQVQYVTEDKEEGAFYPNSDNGCYIPVYMLNVHAHRVGPDSKIYCTQLEQGKKIAEIRAEAIEQAATYLSESMPDKSHESVIFKDGYVYISTRYLREHAETLRQGGAA